MGEDLMLGGTALLRVAGMPLAAWAAAGSPELFARLTEHAHDSGRRAERARALAEALGVTVVPHPGLTAADRRAVLALRRRLHSAAAPRPADCRLLEGLPAARDLAREAERLRRDTESADTTLRELERAVTAERVRVGELGWSLVCAAPVMRAFLHEAAPGVSADIVRRLAEGESWNGQRLRKRGAYLWRALGRAAAKTTPRGWAGQVVALRVAPAAADGASGNGPAAPLVPPGTALGALAAEAVENVHLLRGRLGTLDLRAAGPATVLAPAPLHFLDPAGTATDTGTGVLRCWVIDPRERGRMRQVVLRRTRPLDAVLAQLADGPGQLGDIETALLGTPAIRAADPGPAVLRGFLAHLVELGVLQVCTAPCRRSTAWVPAEKVRERDVLPQPVPAPAAARETDHRAGRRAAVAASASDARSAPSAPAAVAAPTPEPGHDHGSVPTAHTGEADAWFIDSYRTVSATVPAAAVERVQRGLRIAARVAWLRDTDRFPAPDARPLPPELAALDERPRPLGEILARSLPDSACPLPPPQTMRRYAGWHPAETEGSGYARLLAHLADRTGEEQADLDDGLLDALGAPPARTALPSWPLDCLLRPLPAPGPVAVLETASPAGILDARFADALHTLHGGYGSPHSYRAFLAGVERLTGARFVELLVPPLAARAANAVRRPVTTEWWTGDPDPAPYRGPAGPGARYLPLDRITLRRAGSQVIAEADGRRILPVHHATRSPLPPYDVLVRLLMAAGHPAASRVIRLDGLAEAFPGAERLPRVTVGGDLVVSPALWRLSRARLWRPGDSDLAKVRALAALRHSAGLPRFAFVRAVPQAKPVPVDFEALTALHLLERVCAHQPGPELLVEEMLPAPGQLLLHDPLHDGAAVAAQLLLRLPYDRSAAELAALAAAALRGTSDAPGALAPSGRAVSGAARHPSRPLKEDSNARSHATLRPRRPHR